MLETGNVLSHALAPLAFLAATLIAAHNHGQQLQQPLDLKPLHDEFSPSSNINIDDDIDVDDPSHAPLFALHRDLVNINSISGHEHDIGIYLEHYLQSLNLTVKRQPVAPLAQACSSSSGDCSFEHEPPPRFNLFAYPPSHRRTPILLTTHIDTVPPFYPYSTTRSPTNATLLRGRGAVDAKACIAAQLTAAQSLLSRSRILSDSVAHLFVVGEEVGGDGMARFNALAHATNLTYRAVIFGEPTDLRLPRGHKGVLAFTLHAHGKAAHSGYPWLGVSATEMLVRALGALSTMTLPSDDIYGNSTLNIGTISGGVAANVVAANATASVMIRLAGDGNLDDLKKFILDTVNSSFPSSAEAEGGGHITTTFLPHSYGPIALDDDVPGFFSSGFVVNFGTDIPRLKGKHKRYLYGPGSILVAHGEEEILSGRELIRAVKGYEKIITFALGDDEEGGGEKVGGK